MARFFPDGAYVFEFDAFFRRCRCRCRCRVLLLAVLGALLGRGLSLTKGMGETTRCVSYSHLTCLLGAVDVRRGHCHPTSCRFDVRREMQGCVFPESGLFAYDDREGGCKDPFMTTDRSIVAPCGEGRCCRGDHEGDFAVAGHVGKKYDRHVFEPSDSTCRYAEINRGQILHYLRSRNSPIVVAGDSMMRQFFLRLVTMLRGQTRMVDYHQHAHAMYSVCREADMFRISTNNSNATSTSPNDGHLIEKISPFFGVRNGPGTAMARAAMSRRSFYFQRCSRAPALLHYMHLPTFEQQIKGLQEYLYRTPATFVKPVYLVSVGYWTHVSEVPQSYFDALEEIAESARKVIVVTVPTVRVVDEGHRRAFERRNARMARWVEEKRSTHPNTFALLDYDGISNAAHPPPGGADNNWHYMCAIAWLRDLRVDHSREGLNEFGEPIAQLYQGKVERIMATEDGSCGDEMNRALWQVVFNMLL